MPGRSLRLAWLLALLLVTAGCSVPVTIEWTTEVEMDTAGFDLYRSEIPEGPFDVKVNDELIPAADDPMAGGEYSFVDRSARVGKTYYYQLQEIELGGSINSYGPIEVRADWIDWPAGILLAALLAAALVFWTLALRSRRGHHEDKPARAPGDSGH